MIGSLLAATHSRLHFCLQYTINTEYKASIDSTSCNSFSTPSLSTCTYNQLPTPNTRPRLTRQAKSTMLSNTGRAEAVAIIANLILTSLHGKGPATVRRNFDHWALLRPRISTAYLIPVLIDLPLTVARLFPAYSTHLLGQLINRYRNL